MFRLLQLVAVAATTLLLAMGAQAQPYRDRGYHRPPPRAFYHAPRYRRPAFVRHRDERRYR